MPSKGMKQPREINLSGGIVRLSRSMAGSDRVAFLRGKYPDIGTIDPWARNVEAETFPDWPQDSRLAQSERMKGNQNARKKAL